MLEYLRQRLAALLNERAELAAKRDAVLAAPTSEKRDLTDDEAKAFDSAREAIIAHDEAINETRARISVLEEDAVRQANVDKLAAELGRGTSEGVPTGPARAQEPPVYERGNGNSYFRDLVQGTVFGSRDAIDRLVRNDREIADKRRSERALTTTSGAGGEFSPPLWMMSEWIRLARAGRVIADQIRHVDLPPGTDVINLPRLATGTAVAQQASQNTAVQSTDATTNSIAANVITIAGQQVISLQLLEQSPLNIDDILLADLAADYATKLDVFVINNNAINAVGLINAAAAGNQITGLTATTVAGLFPKLADAIQRINTGRFLPPTKIFMHPRRWGAVLASLDTNNRPLVVPNSLGPMNAMGIDAQDVVAEGFVGTIMGLPVYQDPSIPTNLGAGTNQDVVIVARTDDSILFEGTPRTEVFREPLAAQLSLLLRLYNYAAIHASRYPLAIATITGTGLVPPTF